MKTPLLTLALLVVSIQGAWASGAAAAGDDAAYAERMHLIGRTPEAGEHAVPVEPDRPALTDAQRRRDYVARMALIGRTVAFGEAKSAARQEQPVDNPLSFAQRMKLIGHADPTM